VTTCAECKIVNRANQQWQTTASGPGRVRTRHTMQAGSERRWPLFTASNGKVMNEIASFIDACVVVQA